MSEDRVRVASAQYPVEFLKDWVAFSDKVERWVAEAVAAKAQVLLFPEYFSIEITSIFGHDVTRSLTAQLERLQETLPDFLALFTRLASAHDVHICAGSYPVRQDGRYVNRSSLFSPDGSVGHQEKLQMTRVESEQWGVSAGSGLNVFATRYGIFAINVCYDSEFPLLAREQVKQGADALLVPSCTDTDAGFHRVRIGCQARAVENQCYVVQSSTVGNCPWSQAIDVNVGRAAVYAPADHGFPSDGLVAAGIMNGAQWVYADLDLERISRVRREGQVFNHRDWDGQNGHVPRLDG